MKHYKLIHPLSARRQEPAEGPNERVKIAVDFTAVPIKYVDIRLTQNPRMRGGLDVPWP